MSKFSKPTSPRLKLASSSFVYPGAPADRNRWIQGYRGEKTAVDDRQPYAYLFEHERGPDGLPCSTATIFLTNRECPWRCLMCDLWRNTTDETVPPGAIPAQIRFALDRLPKARQVKLYNSGSFFDRRAIPPEDLPEIAHLVEGFERVIVECHPSLVSEACAEFANRIGGRLEVAMGLETAHPEILDKLNKRMTLESFSGACSALAEMDIDRRVFILVKPPFLDEEEALHWAGRSVDFALGAQANVIALIPTRLGNGALDELARQGQFSEPRLETLEASLEYGITRASSLDQGKGARIFADLWDLRRFSSCPKCFEAREKRLAQMNNQQILLPRVECSCAQG